MEPFAIAVAGLALFVACLFVANLLLKLVISAVKRIVVVALAVGLFAAIVTAASQFVELPQV